MFIQHRHRQIKRVTGSYWPVKIKICLNGLCVEQTLLILNYKGLLILLEKIRAYSQKSKEITSPPVAAASVDLAAIVVYPSRLLWCAQLVVCVAMLLFAFVALFPFFKQAFYWLMLWLVFVLAVGVALRYCHHLKNAAPMSFQIKQQRCLLTTHRGIYAVTIDGDVLLWSWLV